MSLASTFVYQLLHITGVSVAGGIVFLMLAISFITQMLSRNFNFRKILVYGPIISMIALADIIYSGVSNSIALFLIATILAGMGQGLTFLGSMGLITHNVSSSNKGYVISIFYIIIYLGVGIPVLFIGLLSVLIGIINSMFIYFILISILSIIILVLVSTVNGKIKVTTV